MVGSTPSPAFLRQLALAEECDRWHCLSLTEEVYMGRDPRCPVYIEAHVYQAVSRHHALVRWVSAESASNPSGTAGWEICDLNSANGTFVNGELVQGGCALRVGDRIQLGRSGPQFILEQTAPAAAIAFNPLAFGGTTCNLAEPHTPPLRSPATGSPATGSPAVTLSQLFPILSTGKDLAHKAYLIPGVITVLLVVLLFLTVGEPGRFNPLLAGYLGAASYYFVYRLCGKPKPWWLLVGTAAFTFLLLNSPILSLFTWFFREVLPGQIPSADQVLPLPILFVRMFLGAGLMEELIKAVPVLLVMGMGYYAAPSRRDDFGVREPLDGILLGAASAVGFTLLETLGQYVPNVAHINALDVSATDAQLAGLQLLIPRLLGSIAGHMAYSGYFGYFIGLSVMVPQHRWRILFVGYGTASLLHALWNVMGTYSAVLLTGVGVASYAFLVAAILKARALSPTRSQNFATRFARR
jgi:RsiW-degrading membrane proteinase PrsW (M82 family)